MSGGLNQNSHTTPPPGDILDGYKKSRYVLRATSLSVLTGEGHDPPAVGDIIYSKHMFLFVGVGGGGELFRNGVNTLSAMT